MRDLRHVWTWLRVYQKEGNKGLENPLMKQNDTKFSKNVKMKFHFANYQFNYFVSSIFRMQLLLCRFRNASS